MSHDKNTEKVVKECLLGILGSTLGVEPSSIDVNERLQDFGLESVEALSLIGEVSEVLGVEIPASIWWEESITVSSLSSEIMKLMSGDKI